MYHYLVAVEGGVQGTCMYPIVVWGVSDLISGCGGGGVSKMYGNILCLDM